MTGWQQESFCYDKLNRVTSSRLANSCTGNNSTPYAYDAIGNITTKGSNIYSYPATGPTSNQPHVRNMGTGATIP